MPTRSISVFLLNGLPTCHGRTEEPTERICPGRCHRPIRDGSRPQFLALRKRAVVHFAVDPSLVYMTTLLKYTAFLPFNRGSAPGKLTCGKGNAPNRTAMPSLWESVWSYDALAVRELVRRLCHEPDPRASCWVRTAASGTTSGMR